jgi:hypothetical protein
MKQEIAQKWITALRSGEYKQTRLVLRTNTGFCCLGVLCDIFNKETGKGEWEKQFIYSYVFKNGHESNRSYLPESIQSWAHFNTNSGELTINGSITSLSILNDYDYTFEQIAQIIEENWKEL